MIGQDLAHQVVSIFAMSSPSQDIDKGGEYARCEPSNFNIRVGNFHIWNRIVKISGSNLSNS